MIKKYFYLSFVSLVLLNCSVEKEDTYAIDKFAEAPQFDIAPLPGDGNTFIVNDKTEGVYLRLWDFGIASPSSSSQKIDTIFIGKKGEHTITLHIAKNDGSGTATLSKKIIVEKDATVTCSPLYSLLTGDCGPGGKCWGLTQAAGAVKVGPDYTDFSWYTSPAGGLQADQYDDSFCFTFNGQAFENKNNGKSVNPWNGYLPEDYNPGVSTFSISEGTGKNGNDQIILDDKQFVGVWDADNVLDIIELTATTLKVNAKLRDQAGNAGSGWFQLTFESK